MIGAIVYQLRAVNSALLSFINGRLMHAAFFKVLHESSPELEEFVHDNMNIKPFTVSFLNPASNLKSDNNYWQVSKGSLFYWRVTALNDVILQAVSSIRIGQTIKVGGLHLIIENVIADKDIRSDAEIISEDDLIASCRNYTSIKEIEFNFLSPVSFRIDSYDAPYPRSELIFSSLADKWSQAQMPADVDKKNIRELAADIRLMQWQGQSKKFYFGHDRGTLAFWGEFKYNLEALSEELQRVFLLLAKFSEFSGVGRLTAQGFGQTRIKVLQGFK